jgi:mono/diheme cytochrome c family protein
MRPKENYSRYIVTGLILTLAILVSFQIYILREPQRIAAVSNADKAIAISAGQELFKTNCVTCHGANGEGDIGPALNDSTFLKTTADGTIFSVISSGIPGTQMPAWNQSHGGPLTDENVNQLVAFLKSWKATAPDRRNAPLQGDAGNGIVIFNSVCAICHGPNGTGTDKAAAINVGDHLNQFDDAWYKDTIMKGRPAKGMPTWGTVLAPQQTADLLALIDQWRASPALASAGPITFTGQVTSTAEVTPTIEVARPSNLGGPGPAVALTGDVTAGEKVFVDNCQKCHGPDGTGGVVNPGSTDGTIPPLNPIDETLINPDPQTYATNLDLFLEHGSTPEGPNPKEKMPAWGDTNKLTAQQIANVIAYVMSLNPAPITSTGETTPTVEVARPSNPGGPGPAVALTGNVATGQQLFVDNCQKCHGPEGTGGVDNPGSTDGTIPPLNPIDETLIDSNPTTYATNLDLFLEHGSTPEGPNPKEKMPAWGDTNKLNPQQIADLIAYVMSLNPAPTAAATLTPEATPAVDIARPSNPGGPGEAIGLTGNVSAGEQVFVDNCQKCHGLQGTGGVDNPGSTDGTIPPLNPIDETLIDSNPATYATNLDLFLEHGSTPEGPNPKEKMPAWGDTQKLTPQQIADVIAYVMNLNPAPAAAPTETPTPTAEVTPTSEVARPSNPGGPGDAIELTGDSTSGSTLFVDNCQKCHGPHGTGGVDNPGSTDGTIPPLNPIDETLIDSDRTTYAINLDLFLEHGSTPEGSNPKEKMPAWGDTQKLTPQQIADLISYVMSLNPAAGAATSTATVTSTDNIARPSNPGDAGEALTLTGDATAGQTVFTENCQKCHGDQGVGGVDNPGSADGTIPPLNPIDDTMISKDPQLFAYNIDLFLEHGSTPEGPNPKEKMPAWGDTLKLTPQQIADVIAYLISLNLK